MTLKNKVSVLTIDEGARGNAMQDLPEPLKGEVRTAADALLRRVAHYSEIPVARAVASRPLG